MTSLQLNSFRVANIKNLNYSRIIDNIANILVRILEYIFSINVSDVDYIDNVSNNKYDNMSSIFIQIIAERHDNSGAFHGRNCVSEDTLCKVFKKITEYLDTQIRFTNLYKLLCHVIRDILCSCIDINSNTSNSHKFELPAERYSENIQSKLILIYHSYISIKMCEYIAINIDVNKIDYLIVYNNYIYFGYKYPNIKSIIKENIIYTIINDTQKFKKTYYSITSQNWNNIKGIIIDAIKISLA